MSDTLTTDICVIGGGSGGLSVAAGASQMGADTVLVESGPMGGDCLNFGCVPSKSILAAAHHAQSHRESGRFGVNGSEPAIDFKAVHDHVHGVIASIAPHDSVERFEGLGVTVLKARAEFTGPGEILAGNRRVRARRFVVATGSSAMVPPVPGLDEVPFLTNETVFGLTELPEHLVVIGGGPIGLELAQAFRRLGSQVTVIEMFGALAKDDPEAAAVVITRLRHEGVEILEHTKVHSVAALVRNGNGSAKGVAVTVEGPSASGGPAGGDGDEGERRVVQGSHLLVAAGRKANVEGLNLEAAGVDYEPRGIKVDPRLRTSNKKIFAIGDVAGGYQFTHMAGYHAGIVIRNALFRLPAKVDYRAVPWVTYTDPELAQVGMSEAVARDKEGDIRILRWRFEENDRAQAEHQTEGFVKVITSKRGRVLGATIVGHHAGELLLPWSMAVQQKQKIGAIANLIAPYPTLSEVSKRAAGSFYTDALFSERTRKIVRFLSRFG